MGQCYSRRKAGRVWRPTKFKRDMVQTLGMACRYEDLARVAPAAPAALAALGAAEDGLTMQSRAGQTRCPCASLPQYEDLVPAASDACDKGAPAAPNRSACDKDAYADPEFGARVAAFLIGAVRGATHLAPLTPRARAQLTDALSEATAHIERQGGCITWTAMSAHHFEGRIINALRADATLRGASHDGALVLHPEARCTVAVSSSGGTSTVQTIYWCL